jgi:hypothetical protein
MVDQHAAPLPDMYLSDVVLPPPGLGREEAEEKKQGRQILPRAGYIPRGEKVGTIQVPFCAGEEGG